MEKYVVRTPRTQTQRKKSIKQEKVLQQKTILSLKRVVVVEDIQRCKVLLDIENQDLNVIHQQLDELGDKIPSREVLEETKIGHTLNKLRKHNNEEISIKATQIYRYWRQHFKEKLDKPKIEVRFDNATNKYRSTSRKLIEDTLKPHKESALLAEAIERSVFHLHSNTSNTYRRHARSIVFTLRYQDSIKEKLLNKLLTVNELIMMKQKPKKSQEI